jgi:phosphoglycolate phosphatase-like HAD superfamily hydrolase
MFNPGGNYLALDFDGVIANSIGECLIVGHNAFVEFSGKGQKKSLLEEIKKEQITQFKKMRNYIRSGEDYVYIFFAMKENEAINNQEDFDTFTTKHKNLRSEFFTTFYKERDILLSEKKELWLKLNPLYPGMKEFLIQYTHKDQLLIITTKKLAYAAQILSANGISFQENNMFHSNKEKNKRMIIAELLDQHQIPAGHFHFIDDQVDTLLKVHDLGINCYLAEWGYNNQEQINRAKTDNIIVQTLEEFITHFSV